jgi:DNA-binding GntR family transcriptional regulator
VTEQATQPTKRDVIAESLRELIAAGEIPRGARIRQEELAERFGTSITPVREAIRLLQAEGLLVGEPRRGVQVAFVDPEHLRSTYILRRLLEPYAMQRAARRVSRRDLEKAGNLLDAMEQAHERNDASAVRTLNRQFHFDLIDRCGVPALARETKELWLAFPADILQLVEGRVPASMKEHREILQVIEEGGLNDVADATATHLRNSYLGLVEHLTGTRPPDPFDVDAD